MAFSLNVTHSSARKPMSLSVSAKSVAGLMR
jgi:hypothetical protein